MQSNGDAAFRISKKEKNMKYSICNVRDFGALGDGSANDAPALQAALDSGAATG